MTESISWWWIKNENNRDNEINASDWSNFQRTSPLKCTKNVRMHLTYAPTHKVISLSISSLFPHSIASKLKYLPICSFKPEIRRPNIPPDELNSHQIDKINRCNSVEALAATPCNRSMSSRRKGHKPNYITARFDSRTTPSEQTYIQRIKNKLIVLSLIGNGMPTTIDWR